MTSMSRIAREGTNEHIGDLIEFYSAYPHNDPEGSKRSFYMNELHARALIDNRPIEFIHGDFLDD